MKNISSPWLLALIACLGLLPASAQNTSPYWSLAGNSNASATTSKLGTTNAIPLRLFTSNLERMRIDAAGNTGIGTTTPENKVHVWKGSAGTVTAFSDAPLVVENSSNCYLNLLAPEGNSTGIAFGKPSSSISGGLYYNNTGFANGLQFRTNGNVTRMAITGAGNVGIGTTTPLTKLHVNGFGSFGGQITAANATRALNLVDVNAVMRVLRVHATNAPAVELISRTSADGPNVAYWDFFAEPTDKSFRIRDRVGGGAGLTRLTISNAGNVGIGTTAPAYPLDVLNTNHFTGIRVINTYSNSIEDRIGISSSSVSANGLFGIGMQAHGGWNGIVANGGWSGIESSGGVYGVFGQSIGTDGGDGRFGVYGEAYNNNTLDKTGSYYAVYGTVEGSLEYQSGAFNAAGYFVGDVWADNYFNTSDRKFKTGIAPLKNSLEQLMKLRPSAYEFKTAEFTNMSLPKGKQMGLIADEVKEVFPELVKQGVHPAKYNKDKRTVVSPAEKYEGVNYLGLIPVLIASIQELKAENEILKDRLNKENEVLKTRLTKLESLLSGNNGKTSTIGNASLNHSPAYLEQNTPNPFDNNTTIRYYVPINSAAVKIVIADISGAVRKSIAINSKGNSYVTLNAHTLPPGSYFYTLWIDGKQIDSKQLIITR